MPQSSSEQSKAIAGVIPAGTLTHFCIVTAYDAFNATLATYARFLGVEAPVPGIAGGIESSASQGCVSHFVRRKIYPSILRIYTLLQMEHT